MIEIVNIHINCITGISWQIAGSLTKAMMEFSKDQQNDSFGEDHHLEVAIFKILFPHNDVCFICLSKRCQSNQIQLVQNSKVKEMVSKTHSKEIDSAESVPICECCIMKAINANQQGYLMELDGILQKLQLKEGEMDVDGFH